MFVQLTFNRLIALVRALALNHQDVAQFRAGEELRFNEPATMAYPIVFLEYPFEMSTVDAEAALDRHPMCESTLAVWVLDRVSESRSPVQGAAPFLPLDDQIDLAVSRCGLIAAQLFDVWRDRLADLNIVTQGWRLLPAYAAYADRTYGVRGEWTLQYPSPTNFCEFPQRDPMLAPGDVFNC